MHFILWNTAIIHQCGGRGENSVILNRYDQLREAVVLLRGSLKLLAIVKGTVQSIRYSNLYVSAEASCVPIDFNRVMVGLRSCRQLVGYADVMTPGA